MTLLAATALLMVAAPAPAAVPPSPIHGSGYGPGADGGYSGPGDTTQGRPVPRPTSPRPAQPIPAAPKAPGPSSPGPRAEPPTGRGAATTLGPDFNGEDLSTWTQWWHYNRAPYLELKTHVFAESTDTEGGEFFLGAGQRTGTRDTLRPSDTAIRTQVVPALLATLAKERARDIQSSALIALAKIGAWDEESSAQLASAFLPFLSNGDQEVAETAAIALGILGREASLQPLFALVRDDPAGRKLVGSTEVSYRTRSFAAFGLGLIGWRTEDNAVRQLIAEGLIEILESEKSSTRDIEVAAVTALGLIRLDERPAVPPRGESGGHGPYSRHVVSRRAQISYLSGLFEASKKNGKKLVRAHTATALARLVSKGPDDLKGLVAPLLIDALGVRAKEPNEVEEACTLALGVLGDADDDELDETIRATLRRVMKTGNTQTRGFAAIATAKVGARPGFGKSPIAGTAECRRALLAVLGQGNTMQKPWAALSLGILGRELLDHGVAPDAGVGQALRAAAAECRRPYEAGAYAVALGLRRDPESLSLMLEKLAFFAGDEARGPIAVGLGLRGERAAVEPLLAILKDSKFRPDLIAESAIGLGLLGDKEVVPELIEMLKNARGLASQASIATALGLIGDQRSLEPLLAMLKGEGLTDTARAFAIVSLGSVCASRPLPWNTPLALDVNYRALTSTLVGDSAGVLDIL